MTMRGGSYFGMETFFRYDDALHRLYLDGALLQLPAIYKVICNKIYEFFLLSLLKRLL